LAKAAISTAPTQPVLDIVGTPLDIGDTVAVAFPDGRSSAKLRVGKILSITETPTEVFNRNLGTYGPGRPIIKVEFEWDKALSGGYVPDKPTKTEHIRGRLLKIK
jgi:hypothetical protein